MKINKGNVQINFKLKQIAYKTDYNKTHRTSFTNMTMN